MGFEVPLQLLTFATAAVYFVDFLSEQGKTTKKKTAHPFSGQLHSCTSSLLATLAMPVMFLSNLQIPVIPSDLVHHLLGVYKVKLK